MTGSDLAALDRGTIENYVFRMTGPAAESMRRLLGESATEDDRQLLANFAASHADAFPRTCEALVRVLDGGK